MIVNDETGVETRIAVLENNRLEELYTERTKDATNVGNIYKGRVTNVESSIQAAFVDFGGTQSGFLHITDVHPRYFLGKNASEKVGKKIAKHDRPPMQKCFKRGDEVLVQVLKEGIGTKGPTLTSYLSIPGRLAVMMPYMDRIGVSRKIEDDAVRLKMRKILDSINLPTGFGFILRTAGVGKNKTEVKRDVAYLLRLWDLIEKRIKTVGAPCPLYSESDLLIRTIRDILRPSISAVVVDSDSAHERISSFLKVVSPRSSRKIVRYRDDAPIFHSFDIERQIEEIHSREVNLPSGGRLVIDQTEALVAIDVNSGKSRDAKNSETNAFNTNKEAADEICRQLRLRDLGGIVINDLIDMGISSNRRKIQDRFTENLKRDRSKTTVLPISRFGILEMTRQRIRPSVLDSQYHTCKHCDGSGQTKTHEMVAADATRHAGWLLQHKSVKKVELTCSSQVGTCLLSYRRKELDRYETNSGKRIVVRISEEMATDRVVYYAYDVRGSDIDLSTIDRAIPPKLKDLIAKDKKPPAPQEESKEKSGRRRGRRRGKNKPPLADATSIAEQGDLSDQIEQLEKPKQKKQKSTPADDAMRVYQFAKQIGKSSKEVIELCKSSSIDLGNHMSTMTADVVVKVKELLEIEKTPPRKRRGKKNKKSRAEKNASKDKNDKSSRSNKKSSKKRRPRRKTSSQKSTNNSQADVQVKKQAKAEPKKPVRRSLYGGRRRSLSTDEVQAVRDDR